MNPSDPPEDLELHDDHEDEDASDDDNEEDIIVLLRDKFGVDVMAIVVQFHSRIDEAERSTWPSKAVVAARRYRCRVIFLILSNHQEVIDWAKQPIKVFPGYPYEVAAVGPAEIPKIVDVEGAKANPQMAVLSAVVNGQSPDAAAAARLALMGFWACEHVEDRKNGFAMWRFVDAYLSDAVGHALEALMRSEGREPGYFGRKYLEEGRQAGREEGSREILIHQLTRRFGSLPAWARARVDTMVGVELTELAARVLSASSLDEALPTGNATGA